MACSSLNAQTTAASWKFKVLDGNSFKRFPDTHYIHPPTPEGLKRKIISILESLSFHGQNVIAQLWAPSAAGLNSLLLVTTYQPAVIYGNNEELHSYHEAFLQHKYYINPGRLVAFGLPGRVFLTCKPEQTQDVHCYPEDQRPRGQYDFFTRKWGSFCVPVILNGRCEGVLEFVTDYVKDSCDNYISLVCTALEDAGLQSSTQIEAPKVTPIITQKGVRTTVSTKLTKYSCLVPYFGQSSVVAADRLGLNEGTFRNLCRRVGIPEWPYVKNTTISDIAVVSTALENAGLQTSTQIEPPKVTNIIRQKTQIVQQSPSSQMLEPTFQSKIRRVFEKVNLQGTPCLVQFWKCNPAPDSEDFGCILTVTGQPFLLTQHHIELERYQSSCHKMGRRFIGPRTKVEDWLVGRAVQTRVADQGTKRIHFSGHTLGLLVLPVLSHGVTCKELEGIIEVVTIEPKESYEVDCVHIHSLLEIEGLESKGMRKTIKVQFNNDIIKFTLSFSAKLRDLQEKVIKRFKALKEKTFSIEFKDTNGNRLPVLSDHDLMVLMKESISKEMTVIRMIVTPIA